MSKDTDLWIAWNGKETAGRFSKNGVGENSPLPSRFSVLMERPRQDELKIGSGQEAMEVN